MKINVHIKSLTTSIPCGDGSNSIQWLADAATIWYLEQNSSLVKKQKIISPALRVSKNFEEELDLA